ncbi:hypothetical protein XAP412_680001 [Xanthomonas phaseoli pv. phaseoli]|uniref:Uncharacterized protein n=1 Tax=Xanthomonas campestris pv. phaseoli TaxID=317013 RepID=A0AB38DWJ9_XANCH|nr:hypothetical protein XAP7430_1560001 [Xanthomonas phaseoli pv. phaseoli]SON86069.1 hypothetical protein XAP6984_720001 [Xanthomonas phaseoli pv. phaseoli]SON88824.1 hypothetical protein XAP412_680001 [Xanthomonas phaseoli pv. phaseoli]
MITHEFPLREAVYQQTQRWLQAGYFEFKGNDLLSILQSAQDK